MTSFPLTPNNVSTRLGSAYTAGSGSLVLRAGDGAKFPALTPGQWLRVTVVQQAVAYNPLATSANFTIYKVTAVVGDSLTVVSAIEGTTDRNYAVGDVVECRVTGGHLSDLQAAVNAIEADTTIVRTTTVYADPAWLSISQSKVIGLTATLTAKADDAAVVHRTGNVSETIDGAKTFTSTVTTTVSNATSATVARWSNPDATVTNGSYDWKIGGVGNFNGELQLINTTLGLIARFNSLGMVLPSGKSFQADVNGGLLFIQNGNTAVTFDTSGLSLRGLTRVLSFVAGVVVSSITSAMSYFTSKLIVGATSLGSAGAQFETRAPDATTPIHAGYTSTNSLGYLFRADGSLKLPQIADSSAVNDSVYYSTTAGKLVYKSSAGVVNPLY